MTGSDTNYEFTHEIAAFRSGRLNSMDHNGEQGVKNGRRPAVRLAKPAGRPIQLRYYCPEQGKEIRISTGSRDEEEALRQKENLEAKLLLGIDPLPPVRRSFGPNMTWSDFREQYRQLHLATVRYKTRMHAEIMHVSWDIPGTIRPVWQNGQLPVLHIPSAMQKNDTDENIPLLPWFEAVLLKTPEADRSGWVFNPLSLQLKMGRKVRLQRPATEWVGRVISRIGKAAGVQVEQADERTGRPAKFATAHDLRRSCGERLRNAGVPPLVICRVMRHSSWETTQKHYAPGDVQSDCKTLRSILNLSVQVEEEDRRAENS